MTRIGLMILALTVLAAGNLGCYYDRWVQADRRNGILEEELARAKADLQDARLMLSQKDTVIDGLNKELIAKDETILTLTAESEHLRAALDKAQQILEGWEPPPSTPMIALPGPLHEKLLQFAEKYPNLLEYDEKKGAVRWKSDLLFPSGSDELVSAGQAAGSLKEFAGIVNSAAAAGFDVVVVGHTDTDPIRHSNIRFKSNWDLSAYRAIAVMKILSGANVAMTRLGIMGYGMFRPIADNTSDAGKAKNRRVEIYLVASDSVKSPS